MTKKTLPKYHDISNLGLKDISPSVSLEFAGENSSLVAEKLEAKKSNTFEPGVNVIALFDLKTGIFWNWLDNEADLQFNKGDIISVIKNVDDNWACGYISEENIGIFPKSYVKFLEW